MNIRIIKILFITLCVFALTFILSSCSMKGQVHRQAKNNKCIAFRGAYAKFENKRKSKRVYGNYTHIMTKTYRYGQAD